jgi:ribosomal protein S18 acetylase RimI-like enzyme
MITHLPILNTMALGFVRPARPDDVAEIARIQLTTWRVAYRRLMPRHVLEQLDEDWIAQQWRRSIIDPPTPRHRVLIALEQAADQSAPAYVVGFAASGPPDEPAFAPDEDHTALGDEVVAVTDLLVEPRWGRRGHGSRLLAACMDSWRIDGFTTAVAWTFVDDGVVSGFLESTGWQKDGASRSLDVDDLLIPQIRWHVAIPTEAVIAT